MMFSTFYLILKVQVRQQPMQWSVKEHTDELGRDLDIQYVSKSRKKTTRKKVLPFFVSVLVWSSY